MARIEASRAAKKRSPLNSGAAPIRDSGFDAGRDAGTDGGIDGGADGGIRDGGFMLQYTSTFDSAAGTGASTSYQLKVVTGWSVGPKQGAGSYRLKVGQPFKTGEK